MVIVLWNSVSERGVCVIVMIAICYTVVINYVCVWSWGCALALSVQLVVLESISTCDFSSENL